MILITGGTGFVGKALIRKLVDEDYKVRVLIRPSRKSPRLPVGISVDVALASLQDTNGLKAAMKDVDTIFHLVGVERQGVQESLMNVDIEGTKAVVNAAREAGVKKLFYVSHLGADRASAYPILKAKAIAEEYIRKSSIPYTIFRTSVLFGKDDGFTTSIAQLIGTIPFFFFLPGNQDIVIQPFWIEDFVTCMLWAIDRSDLTNRTIELGGPEYLTFKEVVNAILKKLSVKRRTVFVNPQFLRWLTIVVDYVFPRIPISVYWLDYLAMNRTCPLDNVPRLFELMPARFSKRLDYLVGIDWRMDFLKQIYRGKK